MGPWYKGTRCGMQVPRPAFKSQQRETERLSTFGTNTKVYKGKFQNGLIFLHPTIYSKVYIYFSFRKNVCTYMETVTKKVSQQYMSQRFTTIKYKTCNWVGTCTILTRLG